MGKVFLDWQRPPCSPVPSLLLQVASSVGPGMYLVTPHRPFTSRSHSPDNKLFTKRPLGTVPPPSANWQAPEPSLAYTNAPPQQPTSTSVAQAPPPPQVEVVPVAPGPDYYWVPG